MIFLMGEIRAILISVYAGNTYQFPVFPANQLAHRAKKRPGTDSQESAPRRLAAGALPTVKYSCAKRQLKILARSEHKNSLKTSADPGGVPSPGSAAR